MTCSTRLSSARTPWRRLGTGRAGEVCSGSLGDVRALTRLVAAGDADAVARLYEAKFGLVFGVARRAGFHEQGALDVAQETFIKVVRGAPVIGSEAALDAWLRRVALRTGLDVIRAETRRAARERGRGAREDGPRDGRVEALRRELAAMDTRTVELLRLRHQAGLTVDAIARVVGMTAGAVDGRLRRAGTRLRERLEE